MRHIQQEPSARRFSPSQFDCPLPPDARDELLQPRRPRILTRPPGPPQRPPQVDSVRRWWHPAFGWLLGLIFFGALGVIMSRLVDKPTASHPVPAPPPVVQPAPAALSPPSTPIVAPIQPTPRTRLVRLPTPPPRAQLVRLPPARVELVELVASHLDETHVITMPYGTVVRATLRGFLGSETQLPRVGRIGDMYVVGTVPWIWTTAPGATTPMWIDP
jgi:hypothetical protein